MLEGSMLEGSMLEGSMLEGSTRSRDTDGADGAMRDVVEAWLNEAATCPEVYGRWTRAKGSG
jgi:hypothetical protein